MADIFSKAKRSEIMSKIKSKDTSIELIFAKELRKHKICYRRNNKKIKGSPDFVITDKNLVVFLDGEFWHGFKWDEKKKRIKSNRQYWVSKIEKNIKRDKSVSKYLKVHGWYVLRFWQHQIKKDPEKCIKKIIDLKLI